MTAATSGLNDLSFPGLFLLYGFFDLLDPVITGIDLSESSTAAAVCLVVAEECFLSCSLYLSCSPFFLQELLYAFPHLPLL